MDQKNLDIYGNEPIRGRDRSRSLAVRPRDDLDLVPLGSSTRGPRPAAVAGVDLARGKFYIVGRVRRKSRNLAENPNCVISVQVSGIDLVVEGTAERVTDDATLERLADRYNARDGRPR